MFATTQEKIRILSLFAVGLLLGTVAVWKFVLPGPFGLIKTRQRFDALVKTNDHQAVASAGIAAIRTFPDRRFMDTEVTNLPLAIALLKPKSVSIWTDSVTIEFAGGFDHFGFRIVDEQDCWEMCWYTEQGQHPLLKVRKQEDAREQSKGTNESRSVAQ